MLKGKTAIITGSSRGIGKAIAEKLSQFSMKLVLTGRDISALRETGKLCEKNGSRVHLVTADYLNPRAPYDIVKETAGNFGTIDILINNAGTAETNAVENTSDDQWDRLLTVNAKVPFILCRESLPYLKKSSNPSIINISSVVGIKGYAKQAVYSASKHALMGFTKALAKEIQEYGIRVHVLSPGAVATNLVKSMRPDLDVQYLIQPEEISEIVVFLLTHRGNAVIDEVNIRRITNTPWK